MLKVFDEGRLFAETYGEGPVRVVWLHGWARRGEDFAACARALVDEGVASISFDLPGFGSSPLPREVGGATVYAETLLGTLREVAREPVVLVGHSFGGAVAVTLAAREPALVRHLILTGTPRLSHSTTKNSAPLAYRTLRWARRRGLVSEARLERARQRYGSFDYRRAHGALREILVASVNEDYEASMRALSTPLTMIWGANDRDAPLDVARRSLEVVSVPVTWRTLEGVGHLTPSEAPHALVDAVREALAP